MPIDPSILLQAKGIQLPDPAEMAMRQFTLGDLANKKRMHEYEMAARARADAQARAYEQALPGAVQGGFSDESLRGVDPAALPALLKQQEAYRKSRGEADKTAAETDVKKVEALKKRVEMFTGNAFELSQNPNLTIDQVGSFVQQARAMGIPVEAFGGMPQDASPQGLQSYMKAFADKGVGALDKLKLGQENKKIAETGRHNLATEGNTVRGQDLSATVSREGHGVTMRGQNVGAETARRGQDLVDRRATESNQISRDAASGAKVNAETQALAKFVDANALPNLITSANALDSTIKKYDGKDIPGVGMTGTLHPLLTSSEGKEVRAKVQAVANDLLKLYSGGAVTANEAERRATEMMASGLFTDNDLRNGWPLVKGRIDAAVQNVRGGFSPEALSTYEGRGGLKLAPVGSQADEATAKRKASPIGSASDHAKLAPGTPYIDPQGNTRIKQ